ncbi:MAG: tripartite tricarboxylate transporter permease [Betaproteobacteria bacterium]|nr:tripartite tricarboxylate transporter permease [Betaproteobacteria bacterium]
MAETLQNLLLGFSVSLAPANLLYCFAGVLLGTVVGVLPGLGSAATIALLLPITFHIPATPAIIMLAGIWYGSMYGGSITSILLRVPGEAASVMTCVDGFEMARQGRAGAALGIAAFASFIAGTAGVIGLMFLAPPLAEFALEFGPPEYFALATLGLTLVSYLGSKSVPKALSMAVVGLLLGTVGLDPVRSAERFTFGSLSLQSGIELVPMVIGLFGLAEVLLMLERRPGVEHLPRAPTGLVDLLPTRQDWRDSAGAITRGTLVGFLVGTLPGAGATISSFVAYALEKQRSPRPERFGAGAIEGVAAPEAANNSATAGGFIPLLTLGIPGNVVTALMLGAFLLHGITPGPTLLTQKPEMFWGVVTSMYVGNLMLLVLNVPLIGLFTRIARVPASILGPLIVLVCLAGTYGVNNNPIDILVMAAFGVAGYLMTKFSYDPAPLVLGFVLGPIVETSLRQSLILSQGSFLIFFGRPIAGLLLGLALFMVMSRLFQTAAKAVRSR